MGFFFAWAVGEGIIVYRWVKNGAPPTPGALALPSALYFGLALAAGYTPARTAATALAWGLDVAVLLQVVGKTPGQATGWPPPAITDPSVILPGQKTATTAELTAYNAAGTAAPAPSASIANPTTGGGTGTGGAGVTLE